jgi:phenylpropionate dioxygenase-like ring-hydroxylating dioxygenase large terminal subunit
MLTKEDNEAITQVGPGTLMGSFMREYWVPAMLSSELPNADCDPLRVRLLGEDLIGFRDSEGRPGLIADLCPHRGTSLFLGRNEEGGLRCVYHGWKFDVTGACVDMPNEPPESNFKSRVKATAYPCTEVGGLVWTYMGSREVPPLLPGLEVLALADDEVRVSAFMRPCNWLQALEGDIDTVHAAILHGGHREPEWYPEGSFTYYELMQRAPHFESVDAPYGTLYGAYRDAGPGREYWRIGQFLFPFWTHPAPGVLGHKVGSGAWVPMDDAHTMHFSINKIGGGVVPETGEAPRQDSTLLPNTTDWYGRFRTVYGMENDFMINREDQRELGSYTGIPFHSPGPEDAAVTITMGSTLNRTVEHLGTSDLMIIRTRQRLLEAAHAYADHKAQPPGLDEPSVYAIRAGGAFIPTGENWLEFTEDLMAPFVDHPEIDPGLFTASSVPAKRHKRTRPL